MPDRRIQRFMLSLIATWVCAGNGVAAYAQAKEEVYPDANFLEYLASLEEVDGEWIGPEDMQDLQEDMRGASKSEPTHLSSELEEEK